MELKIGPQDPLYQKIDILRGPLYSLTFFYHLLTLEAVGGGQGTYNPPPLQ